MDQSELTCQNCGAPLAPGATICNRCGTPVSVAKAESARRKTSGAKPAEEKSAETVKLDESELTPEPAGPPASSVAATMRIEESSLAEAQASAAPAQPPAAPEPASFATVKMDGPLPPAEPGAPPLGGAEQPKKRNTAAIIAGVVVALCLCACACAVLGGWLMRNGFDFRF